MLIAGLKQRSHWLPKTAMVLAAGRGTRLAPLTDSTPKPLLEVGGRAILDRILDALGRAGVETAVINTHHLGDAIADHVAQRQTPAVTVVREEVVLETGGGIRNALDALGPDPFFVINGDSVFLDGLRDTLDRVAEAWRPDDMDVLLLLYPFAKVLGWHGLGDYDMDPLGRLQRRNESHVAPYAYMGVSIVHPRIFADAPGGAFSMNVLYDRAEEAERLYGTLHDGLWYHISTPADLEQANARFLHGHAPDVPFF